MHLRIGSLERIASEKLSFSDEALFRTLIVGIEDSPTVKNDLHDNMGDRSTKNSHSRERLLTTKKCWEAMKLLEEEYNTEPSPPLEKVDKLDDIEELPAKK
ncbi:hypothetical protein AXG93_3911s1070 [Marchantia polymorpha subsp. ruderalis]|uniref:Uncharacterized protein n=1 Tax=Marchantia polymorpha subsp. ruderalis TaxID=1480154 RepID=A0A176W4N5_MARPO|nr:hypothetical protein AXG93_3911s1070 [Marchantia polymorpha subsp. ruderalis]